METGLYVAHLSDLDLEGTLVSNKYVVFNSLFHFTLTSIEQSCCNVQCVLRRNKNLILSDSIMTKFFRLQLDNMI